jgi:hypothetical protein
MYQQNIKSLIQKKKNIKSDSKFQKRVRLFLWITKEKTSFEVLLKKALDVLLVY